MLSLLVFAAAAVPPPNAVPPVVGGLAGCWNAPGKVRGKNATSVARGSWHLGRRYFMLQLRSVIPKSPYEAAIVYGAGEKPGSVGAFWMDTFGGAYGPSLGAGAVTRNGFNVDYHFPDSVYTNRFTQNGKRWRWTIIEKAAGKPTKLFARYDLTSAICRGINFDF